MTLSPSAPSAVPRGVTLLELLLVVVLMTVATALVVPALGRARADGLPVRSALSSARRLAIQRAEPLRLSVFSDGRWAVSTQRDGQVIDSGWASTSGNDQSPLRDAQPSTLAGVLLVDALGGCVPAPAYAAATKIDPLSCDTMRSASR